MRFQTPGLLPFVCMYVLCCRCQTGLLHLGVFEVLAVFVLFSCVLFGERYGACPLKGSVMFFSSKTYSQKFNNIHSNSLGAASQP